MKESLPMPAWRVSVARSRPVSIGPAALMGPPQPRSGRWPPPAQQHRTPPMLATIPPRGGCGSRGAPVVAHVRAALVEVDLLLADLLADLLLLGHGVLVQAHPLPWHRALLDHRLLLMQHHLLPPCSLPIPARRHAPRRAGHGVTPRLTTAPSKQEQARPSPRQQLQPPGYGPMVCWRVWSPTSWALCSALSARSWPCSWVRCLAVWAALLAASWATCLPRSRASCPVSLT